MATNRNLEAQLASLVAQINQYKAIGDFGPAMLVTVRKAMTCCAQIGKEATDQNRRDLMVRNIQQLKQLEAKCTDGEEKRVEVAGAKPKTRPAAKPVAPSRPAQKAPDAKKGEEGQKAEEAKEIEYEFLGVNVEPLLSTEATGKPVTFDDVKGMKDEKALIEREFFISDEVRQMNQMMGRENKKFILLYGVPGTGKTFFAKAISNELKNRVGDGEDIPFFAVVGSQLKGSLYGETGKNIQALFEFCKQFKRCVLFLDEFDELAPSRSSGDASARQTAQMCVPVMLQMMDGFSSGDGTLVIAATNCPYNLDGAILSRAKTRIEIPLPTEEIITATLRSKLRLTTPDGEKINAIADGVDLDKLASYMVSKHYSNRDVSSVISALHDELSDAFRLAWGQGCTKPMSEYRFTTEMFKRALAKAPSSTKPSDMERVRAFKERGE
ncbi:MAG: ATP-binding protein [Clostridia bacterium]|nr:ATP-binding protein [Clostridia bacterium]